MRLFGLNLSTGEFTRKPIYINKTILRNIVNGKKKAKTNKQTQPTLIS